MAEQMPGPLGNRGSSPAGATAPGSGGYRAPALRPGEGPREPPPPGAPCPPRCPCCSRLPAVARPRWLSSTTTRLRASRCPPLRRHGAPPHCRRLAAGRRPCRRCPAQTCRRHRLTSTKVGQVYSSFLPPPCSLSGSPLRLASPHLPRITAPWQGIAPPPVHSECHRLNCMYCHDLHVFA